MDYVLNLWVRLGTGYIVFFLTGPARLGASCHRLYHILILSSLGYWRSLSSRRWSARLIARMQDRPGPNRAWPYGLSQAFADAIKWLTKDDLAQARPTA